jgi:hypothetical protein
MQTIHTGRLQCSHLHLCIGVCRDVRNYHHIHQLQTSMNKISATPELPTMSTQTSVHFASRASGLKHSFPLQGVH